MFLTPKKQGKVYKHARSNLIHFLGTDAETHRVCLFWAYFGLLALARAGLRGVLQAGSCSWIMVPEEEVATADPNSFSMVWDPDDPLSKTAMSEGRLPEMHCWLATTGPKDDYRPADEWEIVDLAAGQIPKMAAEFDLEWRGKLPPQYFWCKQGQMEGCIYEPNREATLFADGLLKQLVDQGKLPHVSEILQRERANKTGKTNSLQRGLSKRRAKALQKRNRRSRRS